MTDFFQTATPETFSMGAMFLGGLLAFVSPCVLPMLPVYALYLMGGTEDGKRGAWHLVLRRCLGLLCGFVLLFTVMGAGAGFLGEMLSSTDRGVLNIVSGVLMMVFGLWMLDVFSFHMSGGLPGFLQGKQATMNGFVGSLLFGLLLAISWTPCLTPVLANALVLAASADNATMMSGVVSLFFFALGLSMPMICIMVFYQWLKGALLWLKKNQRIIRKIGGALMIAYGVYLIFTNL